MRSGKGADVRIGGLGLTARFVVSMAGVLTLVMAVVAMVLFVGVTNVVETVGRDTISRAVRLTFERPSFAQVGEAVTTHASGVKVFNIYYGDPPQPGLLYVYRKLDAAGNREESRFIVPDTGDFGDDFLRAIVVALVLVVLVGAGMSFLAGRQVSVPIRRLVADVRQIAKGDLTHRTRSVGGGEIQVLARAIDRMTHDLHESQKAELQLSSLEREVGLATILREALQPLATPRVKGHDLGAVHLGAGSIAGDFYDFLELGDGRVGLVVCDVSAKGVLAALVGATARSFLRSELNRGDDVGAALRRVNHWLHQSVRRGMFVTALYVLISPGEGRATVACAGHKLPLLRCTAADGKLRVAHPEGIALGLDKGPVFDQRLRVQTIPLEVGDRLFLCNSAPVGLVNAEGQEFGEKTLYARVLKHASLDSQAFLLSLRRDLEQFVGEEDMPVDITLVTIARTG